MKLKQDNNIKFKLRPDEAQILFTSLHKINSYGKKPGFVKSIQFSQDEIEVLGMMRDMLNEAYGMQDSNTVGSGGGHQSSGMITT